MKATITRCDLSPDSFVLMPRYCVNLKAIRYESTSLNRIEADKSQCVIVAEGYYIVASEKPVFAKCRKLLISLVIRLHKLVKL